MKLLAKMFTYKEWNYYWLTKCINKNHNVDAIHFTQPSLSSSGMADVMLFYCYLCRDGCLKCVAENFMKLCENCSYGVTHV